MWYYWLLFFFVAVVAKLLLAFTMIYLLLPAERLCILCDHETLLIRTNRAGRVGSALSLGRVRWRWCPRCGWEGLARRIPPPTERSVVHHDEADVRRSESKPR
ncbi:MAG: hypothetical protein WD737_05715 [Gemmatimonadota bacterium]